ncbi:prolyl oligopeptidase family serine peptidase [Pedobacter frigiditerrae]|uniref:prolyl oligopeptidase family serine peptidase n=1 Tax=Pedobacter frigiditerrae TaxID=2530452 RepID=UPI00293066C6|nr:prolyl oligopeptidase family serine peptidase [Pedobacter frigiditerrae]
MTVKKLVTEKDYPLWSYLEAEAISSNGDWTSYTKYYDVVDSLFVQHRKTGKVYSFAQGSKGEFVSDNHFVCLTGDGVVHSLALNNGKEQVLKNIKSFEVFGPNIIGIRNSKESSPFSIYNLEGRLLHTEDNLIEYATCPDGKKIAISISDGKKSTVLLVDVENIVERKQIIETDGGPFQRLKWSNDGSALAFMHYDEVESKLYYYDAKKNNIRSFSTADKGIFPETMNITLRREIKFSKDNKKVFFRIRQRKILDASHKSDQVQVWNAADKKIYPEAINIHEWTSIDKHALWEPETGRFLQFTDIKLPHGAAVGNGTYALTFNPGDYSPHSKAVGDRDIYITELATGKRKLLLKKHIYSTTNLLASPGGKFISYFTGGNWYVYDISTGIHTLVNKNIPYSLRIDTDKEDGDDCYGNPGWTTGDGYLLIYDQYDIWKVSSDGTEAQRLTKGREKGIVYRIISEKSSQRGFTESWAETNGVFDLNEGLLLKARSLDHFYNGIFLWDVKKGLSEICYTDKRVSTVLRSKNNVIAWMEEDTDLPWQIKVKSIRTEETVLLRSNTHQDKFMWTKREMITYQNSKGQILKGILYYPADYQKGKLYPMVVNIYETQSSQAHYYRLPNLYNFDGFNIGNLTSKGYFVLLPDITYEIGNFGLSAVDAVEAAVKVVLEKYNVDEKRVGLIGHSFGGSQTDFILTQSKMFACAVSGAATTNFLSSYLAVSETIGGPNFYKMEYGQARMKVSPYENIDIYLKNSPVIYAANVTTPLLSWTGLRDTQVLPTQSFEFYMALRRLGKTHILLAYTNGGHDLAAKEDAVDLTRRIEAWFDHYLKDENYPDWAKPEQDRYRK